MGIFSASINLCALMPPVRPKKGVIFFVAQSGNIGTQLLGQGQFEDIGFNKFVCSGNEAGIRSVVFKGGKTSAGAKATSSHSAALAGEDKI